MSYFIIFAITVIFAVELSFFFKKGFGRTAALGNFILLFVLYFSGLFKDMRPGMWIWISAVAVLLGLLIYKVVKEDRVSEFVGIFKNPLFVFYVAQGIALGIMFYNKNTFDWDELSHWGLVSKNMFTYNNFGNLGDTTTMFNRYVPATGVFMYAFQFFNPVFHEGSLYAAFDLFMISMLIPICEKFSKRLSIGYFVTLVFLLYMPVIFKKWAYDTILVDIILAVMAGYLFMPYILDRGGHCNAYTTLEIGLGCCVLTLTKSAGIALVSIVLCFIAADVLVRGRKEFVAFIKNWKNIVGLCGIVLFIVYAKVSWNIYCDVNKVRAGWDASEMTFPAIIEYFKNPNEFQSQVTQNFIHYFFIEKPYYLVDVFLHMPAVVIIPVYAGAAIVLGLRTKKIALPIVQFVMTTLGLLGYAFFMLLLYLFSFSYGESLGLASFPRYMSSYELASFIIWWVLIVDGFITKGRNDYVVSVQRTPAKRVWIWSVPATVLAFMLTFGCLMNNGLSVERRKFYTEPYKEWIEAVNSLDTNDRVYYLMRNYNDLEYLRIRFYATPTRCSGFQEGGTYKDGRDSISAYTGDPFWFDTPIEEFAEHLKNYDYLFIDEVDDAFIDKFGVLFEGEVKAKVLYTVDKTNGVVMKLA